MTPEEAKTQELRDLERDLKARGVIKLSLADEIKRIEGELAECEKQDRIDPRLEAIEKEKKRFQLESLKLIDDFSLLAKNPAFRRFLWKNLELCGLFQLSYRRGDTHESALREGRRSVGLDLLSIMHTADPGLFVQMQHEHASDIKSREGKE